MSHRSSRSAIFASLLILALPISVTAQEPRQGPPAVPDYSDLEETLKRREAEAAKNRQEAIEVEKKWAEFQGKMRSSFEIINRLDWNEAASRSEKQSAWQRFLRDFAVDNPFATQDDWMRDHGKMRLRFLPLGTPRFYDNQDGTVLDTMAGVLWTLEDSEDRLTWNGAISYCGDLLIETCDDWRLPTIAELETLYDKERPNPPLRETRYDVFELNDTTPITIAFPFQVKDIWFWSNARTGSVLAHVTLLYSQALEGQVWRTMTARKQAPYVFANPTRSIEKCERQLTRLLNRTAMPPVSSSPGSGQSEELRAERNASLP